jgi:hypothetical protein
MRQQRTSCQHTCNSPMPAPRPPHDPPSTGRLIIGHKVEVGYLEQTAVSGSERSVWQEARSRMTDLIAAEEAMEAATQAALDGG